MLHNHPLDQLIHDDSLFFLEAMIPFVDYAYKKPLILLIKYQEIRALMQCFDHPDYVASCGFDCHPESSEEMMECMCRFLPGDFAGNIKNMQQMLKMMQVMQAMNDSGTPGPPPYNNCGNPSDFPPPPGHGPHHDFPPQPGCGAPPPPPDYEPRQSHSPDFKKDCTQQGQNLGNSRAQQASTRKDLYSSVMDILNS
ncbi:MAG: hypothetical protein MR625_08785 [Clostridium sp.]|nr:hypothetical protein [Clostridium sp.]